MNGPRMTQPRLVQWLTWLAIVSTGMGVMLHFMGQPAAVAIGIFGVTACYPIGTYIVTNLFLGRREDAEGNDKQCPKCAEMIKTAATVCRYCHYDFVEREESSDVILLAKPMAQRRFRPVPPTTPIMRADSTATATTSGLNGERSIAEASEQNGNNNFVRRPWPRLALAGIATLAIGVTIGVAMTRRGEKAAHEPRTSQVTQRPEVSTTGQQVPIEEMPSHNATGTARDIVTCSQWFNMSKVEQLKTARTVSDRVRTDYQQTTGKIVEELRPGDYASSADLFTAVCKSGAKDDLDTVLRYAANAVFDSGEQRSQTPVRKPLQQPQDAATEPKPSVNLSVRLEASSVHDAGSGYEFAASNLFDGNLNTSWQPASPQNAWIKIVFDKEVELSTISIANGFQTNDKYGDEFELNSRIETAHLTFSDGTEQALRFERDARGLVSFELPSRKTRSLTLFIDSVFAGTRWRDVAISEIRFSVLMKVRQCRSRVTANRSQSRHRQTSSNQHSTAEIAVHNP
jgi:hypothetical protein